jgi:hypothetical protein
MGRFMHKLSVHAQPCMQGSCDIAFLLCMLVLVLYIVYKTLTSRLQCPTHGAACCFPLTSLPMLLPSAAAAGSLRVNDEQLQTRSAAKVKGADDSATLLKLSSGAEGAHFMLIEMAKSSDE